MSPGCGTPAPRLRARARCGRVSAPRVPLFGSPPELTDRSTMTTRDHEHARREIAWRRRARPTRRERAAAAVLGLLLVLWGVGLFAAVLLAKPAMANVLFGGVGY